MSTSPAKFPTLRSKLDVSPVERVLSMVLAMLLVVGVVVFCLLIAWLGSQVMVTVKAVPVVPLELGGSAQGALGDSRELVGLDPQEVAQQTDIVDPDVGDTMATVLDAVGEVEASLGTESTANSSGSRASGRQQGDGNAAAPGVRRRHRRRHRAQRWEVHFPSGSSLDEYARQLDHFDIELGVIGLGSDVFYASHFSRPSPDRRTAPRADERRLYMSWQKGPLAQADRELIRRAGIEATGKVLVQFYPPEVESQLAVLEQSYAQRASDQILRTRFGVRDAASGYEFYVLDQTPLASP